MKKLLMGVALIGLLTACSEQPEETSKELNGQIKVEETSANPENGEPKIDTNQLEINAYATAMGNYLAEFSMAMNDFSQLNTEAGQNPYIINNETWMFEMATVLNTMDILIEDIRSETPPPSLEESHKHTLKAMDEYEYVVDNYPKAIDTLDVDLITSCVEAMEKGGASLAEATLSIPVVN